MDQRRRANNNTLTLRHGSGTEVLFVTDGATHMDLYDGEGVDLAMNKLSPFFKKNIVQASEELQDSHEEE